MAYVVVGSELLATVASTVPFEETRPTVPTRPIPVRQTAIPADVVVAEATSWVRERRIASHVDARRVTALIPAHRMSELLTA